MLPGMKEQHVPELFAHERDRRGHVTPTAVAKIHPSEGTEGARPRTAEQNRSRWTRMCSGRLVIRSLSCYVTKRHTHTQAGCYGDQTPRDIIKGTFCDIYVAHEYCKEDEN